MSEQLNQPNIPSGYEFAQQLERHAVLGPDILLWAQEPQEVAVAHCKLSSGEEFYLASAVGANRDLVDAANGMTDSQRQNADNMLYSRLPEYIQNGYSPAMEIMNNCPTDFPVFKLKNKGGQRVYIGRTDVTLQKNKADDPDMTIPLIIRLAACDKNRQKLVLKHLSTGKPDKGSK